MASRGLLLRADALWDGSGAPVVRPGRLLVDGERIAAVGPELSAPDEAEMVDPAGCTLIPGLIDMHGRCVLLRTQDWFDSGVGRWLEAVGDRVKVVIRLAEAL